MDDAYIQKVLEGDINSFRYLVDRYKDMSFSIAMSILKNDKEAEDVIQDAFIKAFNNLGSFRKKSSFSTWLYRIVVNESLGRIRKKRPEIISELTGFEEQDEEADIQETVQSLARDEQVRYINKVLNIMESKESLLLRLFYLNENNLNEIQDITGLSLSNIRVILHRGRKNFYRLLKVELKEEIRSLL
jgi:RNA polymerase sigma factor (sigma-70 family)